MASFIILPRIFKNKFSEFFLKLIVEGAGLCGKDADWWNTLAALISFVQDSHITSFGKWSQRREPRRRGRTKTRQPSAY